jgi:hypothetical protein
MRAPLHLPLRRSRASRARAPSFRTVGLGAVVGDANVYYFTLSYALTQGQPVADLDRALLSPSTSMDKTLKYAVMTAALLAGGSIFYHYVIYLPGVERQKVEQAAQEKLERELRAEQEKLESELRAEQEKLQKELRAEQEMQDAARQKELRQQTYYSCLADVRLNYEANWASQCEIQREQDLQNCINTYGVYGEARCLRTFGRKSASSPDCSLPGKTADSVNKKSSEGQRKCLAEARLVL